MKTRKPPTLNAADLRLIKDIQLPLERRLTAIERRLTRLEKKKDVACWHVPGKLGPGDLVGKEDYS